VTELTLDFIAVADHSSPQSVTLDKLKMIFGFLTRHWARRHPKTKRLAPTESGRAFVGLDSVEKRSGALAAQAEQHAGPTEERRGTRATSPSAEWAIGTQRFDPCRSGCRDRAPQRGDEPEARLAAKRGALTDVVAERRSSIW
jgi:hypothetical protein